MASSDLNKNNAQPTDLPAGVSRNGRNIGHLNLLERFGRKCVRAVSHLPLGVLYIFADVVYFILYWVLSYRLKVVRENITTIFPHKTEKEKKVIERKFYRHLSDYFFETIKALTISDDELRRRMVIRNPELAEQVMKQGKSVYLYAAHLGNWEWFTVFPLVFSKEFEIRTFYQPQANNFANYISTEVRTRRDITAIESQRGFRYTAQCVRSGKVGFTLIIGDQCPHHGAQKMWLPFCGKDTPFLVGPEHIARKLDIALFYPSFVSYRRGYYEVELKLISDAPASLPEKESTARFASFIEDDLQRFPHLWLLSHRRWKLKHEDFPNEK